MIDQLPGCRSVARTWTLAPKLFLLLQNRDARHVDGCRWTFTRSFDRISWPLSSTYVYFLWKCLQMVMLKAVSVPAFFIGSVEAGDRINWPWHKEMFIFKNAWKWLLACVNLSENSSGAIQYGECVFHDGPAVLQAHYMHFVWKGRVLFFLNFFTSFIGFSTAANKRVTCIQSYNRLFQCTSPCTLWRAL